MALNQHEIAANEIKWVELESTISGLLDAATMHRLNDALLALKNRVCNESEIVLADLSVTEQERLSAIVVDYVLKKSNNEAGADNSLQEQLEAWKTIVKARIVVDREQLAARHASAANHIRTRLLAGHSVTGYLTDQDMVDAGVTCRGSDIRVGETVILNGVQARFLDARMAEVRAIIQRTSARTSNRNPTIILIPVASDDNTHWTLTQRTINADGTENAANKVDWNPISIQKTPWTCGDHVVKRALEIAYPEAARRTPEVAAITTASTDEDLRVAIATVIAGRCLIAEPLVVETPPGSTAKVMTDLGAADTARAAATIRKTVVLKPAQIQRETKDLKIIQNGLSVYLSDANNRAMQIRFDAEFAKNLQATNDELKSFRLACDKLGIDLNSSSEFVKHIKLMAQSNPPPPSRRP